MKKPLDGFRVSIIDMKEVEWDGLKRHALEMVIPDNGWSGGECMAFAIPMLFEKRDEAELVKLSLTTIFEGLGAEVKNHDG